MHAGAWAGTIGDMIPNTTPEMDGLYELHLPLISVECPESG